MTSSRYLASLIPLFTALFVSATTYSQDEDLCSVSLQCESSWIGLGVAERAAVFEFAEDYKSFIHLARTELSFVAEAVAFAEASGFERLTATTRLTAGTKIYEVNRDRTISLLVIGAESMGNGFHVIGSHIDSPRLDLKARPLYEDSEFALFQTNYHGGLKYHQWTNLPLALLGRIDRKDGSTVAVSVGLNADDPVFMIPELSPHVDRGRNSQTLGDFIGPEDLDPVVAHIPGQDDDVVAQVLAYLDQQYAVSRADLVSAELALVPAGPPRDMGFDRGLITAYGQDDRLASYAAIRALSLSM